MAETDAGTGELVDPNVHGAVPAGPDGAAPDAPPAGRPSLLARLRRAPRTPAAPVGTDGPDGTDAPPAEVLAAAVAPVALPRPTGAPGIVVAAAVCAIVPAPFLLVYAGLFLLHGLVVDVGGQPDVTGSRGGEAVAGLIALLLLLVVVSAGLLQLLSGRRRWLLLAGQLITLGGSVYLLVDRDSGEPQLPALVAATSLAAIVLALLPASALFVRAVRQHDG